MWLFAVRTAAVVAIVIIICFLDLSSALLAVVTTLHLCLTVLSYSMMQCPVQYFVIHCSWSITVTDSYNSLHDVIRE